MVEGCPEIPPLSYLRAPRASPGQLLRSYLYYAHRYCLEYRVDREL